MSRWIQDPDTGKLIPTEEYDKPRHKFRGPGISSFHIMPDVEPFVSPIDGAVITSRSKLREHNERHGVVNFHEFDGYWEEAEKKRTAVLNGTDKEARVDRIEDIKRAFEDPKPAPTETVDSPLT